MTDTALPQYALSKPCPGCPFRCDHPPYLRPARAKEIAESLRAGSGFPCHKTTVDDPDNESERIETQQSKQCAGALAVMAREGGANQMMRIALAMGWLHLDALDTSKVYGSLTDFVRAHRSEPIPSVVEPISGEVLEYEHCGVVAGQDCEDPAGFAGDMVYENDEEPTTNPLTDVCHACGNTMCSACRATPNDDPDFGPLCVICKEDAL